MILTFLAANSSVFAEAASMLDGDIQTIPVSRGHGAGNGAHRGSSTAGGCLRGAIRYDYASERMC